MSRTVFVNGSYLPESEGKISIFDRGFLFADGVYEVTAVVNGKLVDYCLNSSGDVRYIVKLTDNYQVTREQDILLCQ